MLNRYDNYITNNIKAYYKRRLLAPILYLLVLLFVWFAFSLSDLLFPKTLKSSETPENAYRSGEEYIRGTFTNLRFTGYTENALGRISGYYYYTMYDEECIILLLSPSTSEQGLPFIEQVSITGRILKQTKSLDDLFSHLAQDLNWTENGIYNQVSLYYVSEPSYSLPLNLLLFCTFFITGGLTLSYLFMYLLFIRVPLLSPACQSLSRFGNPKKLLEMAEEELATLPQLATEDMFITEHFFIETSIYGNAIVPIDEIIWIYKYSTLHKFIWYHFSISYTLHISANKHLYIQCPKNMKSDIDGIIDYLSEANHNILVGFNEENRLKVEEIQGTPMHIKKILELLNKRV